MSATITEQVTVKAVESGRVSHTTKISPSGIDSSPKSSSSVNGSNSSISSSGSASSGTNNANPSNPHFVGGKNSAGVMSSAAIPIPVQGHQTTLAQAEAGTPPTITDLNDLLAGAQILQNRQFILAPSALTSEDSNGAYINWLYDLYTPSSVAGGGSVAGPKLDKVATLSDSSGSPHQPISVSPNLGSTVLMSSDSPTVIHPHSAPSATLTDSPSMETDFPHEANTVFKSQEKYVISLGAPTSIAQKHGEDTLTYLNKGQFYNLTLKANTNMTLPEGVKSVIYVTFFDEPDKRMEYNHWRYWYDLQANPNQRAFDVDRKNCEGTSDKPVDMAYNATSFVWNPKLGAKVVFRLNCLSTEFSSQKGVKGLPLHIVVDTYEDVEMESEPTHRGYCRVKIFRDKGAERKNKDETKTLERRLQKFMKAHQGVSLDSEIGPASVFHPPNKETLLNPTSTFGPKPFLFVIKPRPTVGAQAGFMRPAMSSEVWADKRPTVGPQPGFLRPAVSSELWADKDVASFISSTGGVLSQPSSTPSFLATIRDRETKRTFSNTLSQAKEDLDQLEVGPKKKAPKVPSKPVTTIYVRKEEEKVYNAILLESLTVDDFKEQVSKKYDVPEEMIKNVFKKTKKGLIVRFDDGMAARFEDEDDFIIELQFNNHKGHFDLYIHY